MAYRFHRYIYTNEEEEHQQQQQQQQQQQEPQQDDITLNTDHHGQQDNDLLGAGAINLSETPATTSTPSDSLVSGGHGPQQHRDSDTAPPSSASGSRSSGNTDPGDKDASKDPAMHA
ncbi:hypothetical protein BGZ74_010389 [Mortierella antarctica]|nr:hypothetical protein BGZ74_010389 [Mortierella antarctica]